MKVSDSMIFSHMQKLFSLSSSLDSFIFSSCTDEPHSQPNTDLTIEGITSATPTPIAVCWHARSQVRSRGGRSSEGAERPERGGGPSILNGFKDFLNSMILLACYTYTVSINSNPRFSPTQEPSKLGDCNF